MKIKLKPFHEVGPHVGTIRHKWLRSFMALSLILLIFVVSTVQWPSIAHAQIACEESRPTNIASPRYSRFYVSKNTSSLPSDIPRLEANRVEMTGSEPNRQWQAEGEVVIRHPNTHIETNLVQGDDAAGTITLPSSFIAYRHDGIFGFDQGIFYPNTNGLEAQGGLYWLQNATSVALKNFDGLVSRRVAEVPLHIQGSVARLKSVSVQNTTPSNNTPIGGMHLETVTMTTCPIGSSGAANDREWQLEADVFITHDDTRIGEMHHATLKIGHVPIFYWPWVDFPLDGQRKSGFLVPRLAQRSGYGQEIAQPYYFNLAPHYDMTLTPQWLEHRGTAINNEFRYLGDQYSGTVHGQWMGQDKLSQTRDHHNNARSRLYWQHQQSLPYGFSLSTLWNEASDKDHLKDFKDPIYNSAEINLPIEMRLKGAFNKWSLGLSYLDYQTLTNAPKRDKPYTRKPQIEFSSPQWQLSSLSFFQPITDYPKRQPSPLDQWSAHINGEYTSFTHATLPNTTRAWIYPKIKWQRDTQGYWLNWQSGLHTSRYDSKYATTNELFQSNNRVLPITKGSIGLIFDRQMDIPKWIHTLEPRLYWLYIPYRNQSTLPVLDSARQQFQLSQMEVDNLFSGWDRIADTHQITVGAASRILNPEGREALSIEVGQRLFLEDNRVVLPGEAVQKKGRSDTLFSARSLLSQWRIEGQWRYDQTLQTIGSSDTLIAFQPDRSKLIGMRSAYQKIPFLPSSSLLNPEVIQQIKLQRTLESVLDWPLGKGLSFSGRNYYSIENNLILETHMAMRYDTCCTAITLSRTNALLDANQKYEARWSLEITLKGLTQLGSQGDALLDKAFKPFRVY